VSTKHTCHKGGEVRRAGRGRPWESSLHLPFVRLFVSCSPRSISPPPPAPPPAPLFRAPPPPLSAAGSEQLDFPFPSGAHVQPTMHMQPAVTHVAASSLACAYYTAYAVLFSSLFPLLPAFFTLRSSPPLQPSISHLLTRFPLPTPSILLVALSLSLSLSVSLSLSLFATVSGSMRNCSHSKISILSSNNTRHRCYGISRSLPNFTCRIGNISINLFRAYRASIKHCFYLFIISKPKRKPIS
jgi:hypothetical protein